MSAQNRDRRRGTQRVWDYNSQRTAFPSAQSQVAGGSLARRSTRVGRWRDLAACIFLPLPAQRPPRVARAVRPRRPALCSFPRSSASPSSYPVSSRAQAPPVSHLLGRVRSRLSPSLSAPLLLLLKAEAPCCPLSER